MTKYLYSYHGGNQPSSPADAGIAAAISCILCS